MIIETRVIYHCEYCNKISLQKSSMTRHEKACKKSPHNIIQCRNCIFRGFVKEAFDYKEPRGEDSFEEHHISFEFHFCYVRNIKMIPPKAYANEFYNGALKGRYDQVTPTLHEGCSEHIKDPQSNLIEFFEKQNQDILMK